MGKKSRRKPARNEYDQPVQVTQGTNGFDRGVELMWIVPQAFGGVAHLINYATIAKDQAKFLFQMLAEGGPEVYAHYMKSILGEEIYAMAEKGCQDHAYLHRPLPHKPVKEIQRRSRIRSFPSTPPPAPPPSAVVANPPPAAPPVPAGPTPQQLAHQAAYAAHLAAEQAEAREAEAARKQRALEARAKKDADGEAPYTVTLPQKGKQKMHTRDVTELEARVHAVHIHPDQKAYRAAAFEAKQEREHLGAVARKARANASSLRMVEVEAGKREAAAGHTVPALPTIAEFVE